MKQKILILGALFFGILAAYLTWSLIDDEQNKIKQSQVEVSLLQATRTLAPLATINDNDFVATTVMRHKSMLNRTNEIYAVSLNAIKGKKLKGQIKKGEIVRWNDIDMGVDEGTGFSRLIEDDTRAITLPCSQITSVANLIRPRDRVDILGTFQFPDQKGDKMMDTVTLTVLQDVMILATGTEYGQTLPTKGELPQKSYGSITVQVSPSEAEMLTFARQKGELTFTLRKPSDVRTKTEFNNVNWKYLIDNLNKFAKERETYNLRMRNFNR